MSDFEFPYKLDSNGPKGISIESWLDRRRLGLVLVDFQNYWLDEKYGSESEIVWGEGTKGYVINKYKKIVLPNTLKFIRKFRDLNMRIIYTRNASSNEKLLDIQGLLRKVYAYELKDINGRPYHMYYDEYDSQIVDEVKPEAGDIIINKTSMGVFNSSDIDNVLKNNGIYSLVFIGGYTDACLSSSVRGAYDRGYLCIVPEDACIANVEEDHLFTIKILDKYFAWITDTENILKNL